MTDAGIDLLLVDEVLGVGQAVARPRTKFCYGAASGTSVTAGIFDTPCHKLCVVGHPGGFWPDFRGEQVVFFRRT